MKKIVIFSLIIFLATLIFFALKLNQVYKNVYTPKKNGGIKEKNDYNLLILGYGGGRHQGAYLTDTIIVSHIDLKTKKIILLSLPRDLWVKIPTISGSDFFTKINSLYQIGLFPKNYPDIPKRYKNDALLTKKIISQIIGEEIDYYLSVDFEGFKKIIDILGGVDVNVPFSFIDQQYPIEGKETDLCDEKTAELFKKAEPFFSSNSLPDEEKEKILKEDPSLEEFIKNATSAPYLAFPCRYQYLEFKKGLIHMDGETALKYARSRHSPTYGGDFNRAKRQQQIIEAIKEKAISLNIVPKIIPFLDQLEKNLKTDIGIEEFKKVIKLYSQQKNLPQEFSFSSFVLSTDNFLISSISSDGQYILIPRQGENQWEEINQAIKNLFHPTPTPTATSSPPKKM